MAIAIQFNPTIVDLMGMILTYLNVRIARSSLAWNEATVGHLQGLFAHWFDKPLSLTVRYGKNRKPFPYSKGAWETYKSRAERICRNARYAKYPILVLLYTSIVASILTLLGICPKMTYLLMTFVSLLSWVVFTVYHWAAVKRLHETKREGYRFNPEYLTPWTV